MENNANNQNSSPEREPQPIRWGYVVAAIIVIAIVVLAEMFHPRSSRNQIKAYEAQIEAQNSQK
jgi:predicted Abi (CAAX) family protease